MATLVLLLFILKICFSCNVHSKPKNRAKVIEDYVLSANFDEKTDLPQLRSNQTTAIAIQVEYEKQKFEKNQAESKEGSIYLPGHRYHPLDQGEIINDYDDGISLKERDLLVHHHHVAPVPTPPPPPPPPPAPVASSFATPLVAVGFITFLILLNALQTSLLLTIKQRKPSLLGTVTGALGRRKRSLTGEHFYHTANLTGYG